MTVLLYFILPSEISRIGIARSMLVSMYFYLGRKSPVVMEIYRGPNIDINARQRRQPSRMSHRRLNHDPESLCGYRG